jgi:glycosyltransferase involved in cell wall biosynthesis
MPSRVKVLIVGQTPPPHHGQSIMIKRLLRGQFTRVQLFHVRMAFSDAIGNVGRFQLTKLFHLASVIVRIIICRLIHRPSVLCYPPAGPNRVPVYRDVAILLCTRWMFRRTILYFHAGGISEIYPQLSPPMRWLFRKALFNADAAIRISQGSPNDGQLLHARAEYIVPNGIEDEFEMYHDAIAARNSRAACELRSRQTATAASTSSANISVASNSSSVALAEPSIEEISPIRVLFLGILCESKGLLVLLDACGQLAARGVSFELRLAGQFASSQFKQTVMHRISELNLENRIQFLGQLNDDAKWRALSQADVLCLPTFYEAETFGLVLVEAMSFALPVVATKWRGIPEIVDDGVTGYLVEIQDPAALANRLQQLQLDPPLRQEMGIAGRTKFLSQFTAERYWQRMETVFTEVAT